MSEPFRRVVMDAARVERTIRRMASQMAEQCEKETQLALVAVGRGGVVLIGEGPRSRTEPMLAKERANVNRIVPKVPVTFVYVTGSSSGLRALTSYRWEIFPSTIMCLT